LTKKYKFHFPQYTPQYFNRTLKSICKAAGINTQVRLTRYQGSKEIIIEKLKHDLITSHTARRTSVSLLLAKGVPPTVVMKLTGHTDITTMMKYERTTTELLENHYWKFLIRNFKYAHRIHRHIPFTPPLFHMGKIMIY